MRSGRVQEAFGLPPTLSPMEAKLVTELPDGKEWQYEPKWDGFRCLAFRAGSRVELVSKAGKPLSRYFPEVVASLSKLHPNRFVIDGEILISLDGTLSFDSLQMRLHPAQSRIEKLSREIPAELTAFDLLYAPDGSSLVERPFRERRKRLETVFAKVEGNHGLILTPCTRERSVAVGWLTGSDHAIDGVIAKRLDLPYRAGERAMLKVKRRRTADCVVGGFRYETGRKLVGSLLLGLYDDKGLLHHVGFTSGLSRAEKPELTRKLEKLIAPPGFTGDAPGGPTRWRNERSGEWEPLRPELVVEVRYDHVTGNRFRHGTRLLRWRPDKSPRQCRMEQLDNVEAKPVGG